MLTTQPCERLSPSEQLAAELAALATDLLVALTERAILARYGLVEDGLGGRTEGWLVEEGYEDRYPDGIPTRIAQGRPGQPISLGGRLIDSTDDYRIDYPNDVHLNPRDRLTIGATTYEVQAVDEVSTTGVLNTAWAIVAET